MKQLTGSQIVLECLKEQGVDTVFGYPGGAILNIYDELYKQQDCFTHILTGHEQGASHAADGYARSTGKVGVCFATSGPGATNIVTGIATAYMDSIPMVAITCNVGVGLLGKDSFQEVDITGITLPITKHNFIVKNVEDLADTIRRAFRIAQSGRKGPVLIDIPKDVTAAVANYKEQEPKEIKRKIDNIREMDIRRAVELIESSTKPFILVGGGAVLSDASEELREFVEKVHAPVADTLMGKGAINSRHPLYLGNVGIHGGYAPNVAITDCDVMISIGTRFNDRITGKLSTFAQNCKIVHIDVDAASISKNIKVDIPIVADAKLAIEALLEYMEPHDLGEWPTQLQQLKVDHPITQADEDGLTPEAIIQYINDHYERPIVTTDVGQNQLWTTQFLEIEGNHQLLTSGGLGTMGYGFPAAIGAKFGNPHTPVFAICGDGGVQMNIQEFATAMHYHLPVTLVVINNGYLGNVRQWQQLFYDKRYACTNLLMDESAIVTRDLIDKGEFEYVPDFVKLAEAYGAQGVRVTKAEELRAAFAKADAFKKGPTLIECIIPTEVNVLPMVPAGKSLSDMLLKDKK